MTGGPFPGGKRFAFTIMDDTDVATVENVQPIYRLLERLGMRTTKTVWAEACPEGSPNFGTSQTLDDPEYRAFAQDLQQRGFEIAFHGATMETSTRERTIAALERFRSTFGDYPRVHANHAYNRENLYWGGARIDLPELRLLWRLLDARPSDHYRGHCGDSPYWWGDLCARHVTYVRNLTFNTLNVAGVNPSMPYHDPARPLVRWWFSAADAEDADEFSELLGDDQQERLEREGGVCIVATHLGKGFAVDGRVHPLAARRLEALARRDGWFPTVGDLLDWLRARRGDGTLPRREWVAMQRRWALDLVRRKWRQRRALRRRSSPGGMLPA
jgi:hypothetical protein